MSGLAQLFAGANFQNTIQRYCAQQRWRVADISDDNALLRFNMESGREQSVFIFKYDTTLEFSVPSALSYDTVDEVPHYISTLLLKRNADKKIGFWSLIDTGKHQIYSCMHNVEMTLIDGDYFASIVRALIRECDELEGVAARL